MPSCEALGLSHVARGSHRMGVSRGAKCCCAARAAKMPAGAAKVEQHCSSKNGSVLG